MTDRKTDRKTIQDLYIRVCKDSGFRMDYIKAAAFTAEVLKIHPLEVWIAFSGLDVMERISKNNHPAVNNTLDDHLRNMRKSLNTNTGEQYE